MLTRRVFILVWPKRKNLALASSKMNDSQKDRIQDCWSQIEKAVSALSNPKLDDCIKYLNDTVFGSSDTKSNDVGNETTITTAIKDNPDVDDYNYHQMQQWLDELGPSLKDFIGKPVS